MNKQYEDSWDDLHDDLSGGVQEPGGDTDSDIDNLPIDGDDLEDAPGLEGAPSPSGDIMGREPEIFDENGELINNPTAEQLEQLNIQTTQNAGRQQQQTDNQINEDNLSGIERYLSNFDIEGGMIQLFDDATGVTESVHFNDLTSEKQAEILSTLHSQQATSVEERYGLDENETGLINYLRSNNTTIDALIDDMVNDRLQNYIALQQIDGEDYDSMSDDAVYLKMMKTSNPGSTQEQLESDLEKAKQISGYKNMVETFRNQFKTNQQMAFQQQQYMEAQQEYQSIEDDRARIVRETAGINEIGGTRLTPELKNNLYDRILEVNEAGDSLFMQDAFSQPKDIMNAAFWYYYGPSVVEQLNNYWKLESSKAYKRGREEVLGTSGSDGRISFTSQSNTTPQNNNNKEEEDWDDLH